MEPSDVAAMKARYTDRAGWALDTGYEFVTTRPGPALDMYERVSITLDVAGWLMEQMREFDRLIEQIDQGPETVSIKRTTAEFAATALESSSDNGDRFCARQIRERLDS